MQEGAAAMDFLEVAPLALAPSVTARTVAGAHYSLTLTLTGSATLTSYRAMLRSVAFSSTSSYPATHDRVVTVQIQDSAIPPQASNALVAVVQVRRSNERPVLSLGDSDDDSSTGVGAPPVPASAPVVFVEKEGPVAVVPRLLLRDADNRSAAVLARIVRATVSITGNYDPSTDTLALGGSQAREWFGAVTWSSTGGAGTLVVERDESVEAYQAMLRSVQFDCQSNAPRAATRTVHIQVDDANDPSLVLATTLSVLPVNDLTQAKGLRGSGLVFNTSSPLSLLPDLELTDMDSDKLQWAEVQIRATAAEGSSSSRSKLAGDQLSVSPLPSPQAQAQAQAARISTIYQSVGTNRDDPLTWVSAADVHSVVLSNAAPLADYQVALRTLTFSSALRMTEVDDRDRIVTLLLNDGHSTASFNLTFRVVRHVSVTAHPRPASSVRHATPTDPSPYALSAAASGTPPLSYRWYKFSDESMDMDSGSDSTVGWPAELAHIRDQSQLRISTVLRGVDDGVYRCKVTNEASEAWTDAARLEVRRGPPTWYSRESNRQLIVPKVLQQSDSPRAIVLYWPEPAGNGGTLSGYQLEYKTEAAVASSWVVATDNIPHAVPIELILGGNPGLFQGNSADRWQFRVTASSSSGRSHPSGVVGGVLSSPTEPYWNKQLSAQPVNVNPHGRLVLAVKASGFPAPIFQWFKDGQVLELSGDYAPSSDDNNNNNNNNPVSASAWGSANNGTLIVTGINENYAGEYEVVASNYRGKIRSGPVAVALNTAPTGVRIEQLLPFRRATAVVNEAIRLDCVAASPIPVRFFWTRNGKQLEQQQQVEVEVEVGVRGVEYRSVRQMTMSAKHEGEYRCIAVNSVCEEAGQRQRQRQRQQTGAPAPAPAPGSGPDSAALSSTSECPVSGAHHLAVAPCMAGQRRGPDGACLSCEAGRYQQVDLHYRSSCSSCGAGRYQDQGGKASCLMCMSGYHQDSAGQSTCRGCPQGRSRALPGGQACDECTPGLFSDVANGTQCAKCARGRAQETTGKVACTVCARGKFSPSEGLPACTDCRPGRHQPALGSLSCEHCEPGQYQDAPGQPMCTNCPTGKYGNGTGWVNERQCQRCLFGTSTERSGANSSVLCVCTAGSYNTYGYPLFVSYLDEIESEQSRSSRGAASGRGAGKKKSKASMPSSSSGTGPASASGGDEGAEDNPTTDTATAETTTTGSSGISSGRLECSTFGCGDRIDCSLVGNEVHELVALPGYWRPTKYTDSFFECGDGGANCHGGPFEDQCANHSTGPLCKMCMAGYIRKEGFCEPCSPPMNPTIKLYLPPFAAAIITAILAWYLGSKDKIGRLTRGLQQDHVKAKTVTVFVSQGNNSMRLGGAMATAKSKNSHLLLSAASAYKARQTTNQAASAFGLAAATNPTVGGSITVANADVTPSSPGTGTGTGTGTGLVDRSQAEQLDDNLTELHEAKKDAKGAVDDTKVAMRFSHTLRARFDACDALCMVNCNCVRPHTHACLYAHAHTSFPKRALPVKSLAPSHPLARVWG
jgi:hypothetical protein